MELSDILSLILGTVGMVTGLIGLFISFFGYNRSKYEIINSFFQYMSDPAFIAARKYVYNMQSDKIIDHTSSDEEQNHIAIIANTYHHWGLLVKNKQLPKWLFYDKDHSLTASGIAVIRMYTKMTATIDNRRRKGNPEYARYFEWLYNYLIRKCPNSSHYTS